MYAIRSYYDVEPPGSEGCVGARLHADFEYTTRHAQCLHGGGYLLAEGPGGLLPLVITSYSIHYTKLYDVRRIPGWFLFSFKVNMLVDSVENGN